MLFGQSRSLKMQCIWQATRIPGQSKFYGKNGIPSGRVLRDKNSGIFLSHRDIWHVCLGARVATMSKTLILLLVPDYSLLKLSEKGVILENRLSHVLTRLLHEYATMRHPWTGKLYVMSAVIVGRLPVLVEELTEQKTTNICHK